MSRKKIYTSSRANNFLWLLQSCWLTLSLISMVICLVSRSICSGPWLLVQSSSHSPWYYGTAIRSSRGRNTFTSMRTLPGPGSLHPSVSSQSQPSRSPYSPPSSWSPGTRITSSTISTRWPACPSVYLPSQNHVQTITILKVVERI